MNRILFTTPAVVLSHAALSVDLSGDWQFGSKVVWNLLAAAPPSPATASAVSPGSQP